MQKTRQTTFAQLFHINRAYDVFILIIVKTPFTSPGNKHAQLNNRHGNRWDRFQPQVCHGQGFVRRDSMINSINFRARADFAVTPMTFIAEWRYSLYYVACYGINAKLRISLVVDKRRR